MKAVVFRKYGGPEVLHLADVEKPLIGDSDVLIQVKAAEVTKGDCELRSFNFPVKWFSFPLRLVFGVFKPRKIVLGGYFSGVIEAVGPKAGKFNVGEEVFGCCRMKMGAYAEYLVLPASYTITPKPANLGFAEAAAVPLGGLNALHFMRKAKIQEGDEILVNGAGGSIGTFGIQIAQVMGARVTAVDSAIKRETLLALGIEKFIDYTQQDFRILDKKYDVIFDMVASSPLEESVDCLKPGGRYVTANPSFRKMIRAGKVFKNTGKKVIFAFAAEVEEELLSLKSMIEADKIFPVLDKVYPMDLAAEAHRRVEQEERLGIVVMETQ